MLPNTIESITLCQYTVALEPCRCHGSIFECLLIAFKIFISLTFRLKNADDMLYVFCAIWSIKSVHIYHVFLNDIYLW